MGIESISGIAGFNGYQGSTVVRQSAEPAQTAPDMEAVQSQASQTSSAVSSAAAAAREAEANGNGADTNDKKQDTVATMKDINALNRIINRQTVAEFGVNEPTNRITVKIKDKETDEVIREIPSEKALEMLAKAWEIAGILVDEKL